MESYKELVGILDDLDFGGVYQERFQRKKYVVEYNEAEAKKAKKDMSFSGVEGAGRGYFYKSAYGDIFTIFQNAFPVFDENEIENFVYCVKVLDWGNVTKSNIHQVVNLYEGGELTA